MRNHTNFVTPQEFFYILKKHFWGITKPLVIWPGGEITILIAFYCKTHRKLLNTS
eukprot:TRINITY_DN2780_c1_g1_i1.p3 TRINITY_DN2780_c1_g1~~TRINITY_DN2780_c1_g1_i1.p3  ORF type:complete len:55 (+),score=4.83 TRINITY_DN2780_c1_g1_i1:499-663(+)